MKAGAKTKWPWVLLLVTPFLIAMNPTDSGAQALQSSTVCLRCHNTVRWLDNNPISSDVQSHNTTVDYLPPNLSPPAGIQPFYRIGEGYLGAIHNIPFPSVSDEVKCAGCHISLASAHSRGAGSLPGTSKCGDCHDTFSFLSTTHANPNGFPGKFFDQLSTGRARATSFVAFPESPVTLYKTNQRTGVTRNERIDECSVCHNYALQYSVYKNRIARGGMPDPQVGCPTCHDSHIPAPDANHRATVSTTVTVASASGSTVLTVTPGTGREVSYRDLKPYKIDDTGAQNLAAGTWARGSSFIGANLALVSGTGTISDGAGTSTRFTFPGGGFLTKVRVHDTLFISGNASATGMKSGCNVPSISIRLLPPHPTNDPPTRAIRPRPPRV